MHVLGCCFNLIIVQTFLVLLELFIFDIYLRHWFLDTNLVIILSNSRCLVFIGDQVIVPLFRFKRLWIKCCILLTHHVENWCALVIDVKTILKFHLGIHEIIWLILGMLFQIKLVAHLCIFILQNQLYNLWWIIVPWLFFWTLFRRFANWKSRRPKHLKVVAYSHLLTSFVTS